MAVKTDLSECSDINLEHAMFSQFGFFALYALLIDFIPLKQKIPWFQVANDLLIFSLSKNSVNRKWENPTGLRLR